jgi:hypothetical protein
MRDAFGRGRDREDAGDLIGSRTAAGDVRRRLLPAEHAAVNWSILTRLALFTGTPCSQCKQVRRLQCRFRVSVKKRMTFSICL